jgi:two-component system LytT family response regulator
MITAIIVDDEKTLGEGLKRMLETHHSDIKVMDVCYNIMEAEKAINELKPRIVFLDIELENGLTSFDLLKKIPNPDFEIIFTTGFNQYAIRAIKFSAIGYLLKPIDKNELKLAIEKFRAENFKIDLKRIESFMMAWANPGAQQNKIPLPTMGGYDMLSVSDILYCEGLSSQTLFVLNNKKEIIISMTLKECEDILTPYNFFRIHKSHLINLNYVKRYTRGKDGTGNVLLLDEVNLVVSKGFREAFVERLKTI